MRTWKFIPITVVAAVIIAGGIMVAEASAGEEPLYIGTPAARGQAVGIQSLGQATLPNWAGYAATPGTTSARSFVSATASWTQPKITCTAPNAAASAWVGLDGFDTKTVEQIGSLARCIDGTPRYELWWEMYPEPATIIRTIKPGDKITASVTYRAGSDTYELFIQDSTLPFQFAVNKRCPTGQTCGRVTAEVIAEAPGDPQLPLANYGQVVFSGCTVTDAGSVSDGFRAAAPWQVWQIQQTDGTTNFAKTGPTTPDGRSFPVTWLHA